MEDWMYASGWDKSDVRVCDGYHENKEKKIILRANLRCFCRDNSEGDHGRSTVFLVETTDDKVTAYVTDR